MYHVIAIDRKTGEEVRRELIDEQFVTSWVEIFIRQGCQQPMIEITGVLGLFIK